MKKAGPVTHTLVASPWRECSNRLGAFRMIVPATQRFMAERMHARDSAHPVDHAPSVTAPGPVVELIVKAAHE